MITFPTQTGSKDKRGLKLKTSELSLLMDFVYKAPPPKGLISKKQIKPTGDQMHRNINLWGIYLI